MIRLLLAFLIATASYGQGLVLIDLWPESVGGGSTNDLLNGLTCYWKFDEASGSALDSSGNARHLTEVGTIASTTGKLNGARTINRFATNSFETADADWQGVETNGFTFTTWFKLTTLPGSLTTNTDYVILNKPDSSTPRYELSLNYSLGVVDMTFAIFEDASTATLTMTPAAPLETNIWYFVCASSSVATRSLYLGSEAGGALQEESVAESETFPITIGGLFRLGTLVGAEEHSFDGILDEAGFWGRTLTTNQINTLYNSGTPFPYASFN